MGSTIKHKNIFIRFTQTGNCSSNSFFNVWFHKV